jgi:DNA repair protein RecO (recombination protein O)
LSDAQAHGKLTVVKAIESDALVVRKVAYGEADVIATLLTETHGKLAVLMRGGRKSKRRAPGALEPFHTVHVSLEDRGSDLVMMREARVVCVRSGITGSLEALEAGGLALRWLRHLSPPRHPEPEAWATTLALLDALDGCPVEPRTRLAVAALRLLSDVGYGLDLARCVACGRPCPEKRPAYVDASRGGLVCQSCGGARFILSPNARRVALGAQRREDVRFARDEAEQVLAMVDGAMAAHSGFENRG